MITDLRQKRTRLMSVMMALLVMFNIFLPSGTFAADFDETIMQDTRFTLTQSGGVIAEGGSITAAENITVSLDFNIPVGAASNGVEKGKTMSFALTDAFVIANEETQAIYTDESRTIKFGTARVFNDGGTARVEITFDGDDEAFNVDPNEDPKYSVHVGALLKYEGDKYAVPEAGENVSILGKTFILKPATASYNYTISKTGAYNLSRKKANWAVKINGYKNGSPEKVDGVEFVDDLSAVGEYVDGSFKVNGTEAIPVIDGGKLTYKFPENSPNEATVTFETKIPDDKFFVVNTQRITNTASILDSKGESLGSASAEISYKPVWITKKGEASDKGSTGAYTSAGRTITWTITANEYGATLPDAYIIDKLKGNSLGTPTLREAYWQKWDGSNWTAKTNFDVASIVDGKYELGTINSRILLTIVANVPELPPDKSYTAEQLTFSNEASIHWTGFPGVGSGSVGATVGFNAITENNDNLPKDGNGNLTTEAVDRLNSEIKRDILTWRVKVEERKQNIPNLTVYNVASYSMSGFDFTRVQGLPSGISLSDYHVADMSLGQRFVPGSFTMVSGTPLDAQIYTLTIDGKAVGEIMVVKGFNQTQEEVYTFKTQVVEPEYQLINANYNKNIRNKSLLYSANAKLNSSTSVAELYHTGLAYKETIERTKYENIAQSVDEFTGRRAGSGVDYTSNLQNNSYNYEENAIVYRLTINPSGIDLSNREYFNNANKAFERYGDFYYEDELPAGWEFIPVSGADNYLIFEGKPERYFSLRAFAKDTTPDSPAGFSADFSQAGKAKFTFANLDKPYVILLKARPTQETLRSYVQKGTERITNKLIWSAQTYPHRKRMDVFTNLVFTPVVKYYDATKSNSQGILQWTIDFNSANLPHTSSIIEDKLPVGLDLPADIRGNIIPSENGEDYFSIYEMSTGIDGVTRRGDAVEVRFGQNVKYDRATRTLTFVVPDNTKSYQFGYTTLITGDPGSIDNRVTLKNFTESSVETAKNYSITDANIYGVMNRMGYVKIDKVNGMSTATKLENAGFTLYLSDGTTEVKSGKTNAQGVLLFRALPDGEYKLRETTAPDGFENGNKTYEVVVKTESGKKVTTIDGQKLPGNTIQVKNYAIRSNQIKVTNTVYGGASSDRTKDFTYTFKIDARGAYPFVKGNKNSSGTTTGTISNNGNFTLKHDEYIVFKQLPDKEVRVIENPDGYKVTTDTSGLTMIADATLRGTPSSDTEISLDFYNTKDTLSTTFGGIKVFNTVKGDDADPNKQFEYKVTFSDGGTYKYTVYKKVGTTDEVRGSDNDKDIVSGGTITLAHNEHFVISKMPANVKVTVVEKPDDYQVTPQATQEETIVAGTIKELLYENTKNRVPADQGGNIKITNTVIVNSSDTPEEKNQDKNKDFNYIIEFASDRTYRAEKFKKDGLGNDVKIEELVIRTGKTFTLKDGESFIVYELPADLNVEVRQGSAGRFETEPSTLKIVERIVRAQTVLAPFVNRKVVPVTGSVDIKNTVIEGNGADLNKYFNYRITFANPGSFDYTTSYGASGTISSGQSVPLKSGDIIVIEGMPSGLVVVATQSSEARYTTTPSLSQSATIVAGQRQHIEFVNRMPASGGGTGGTGGGTGGGGGVPYSPVRPPSGNPGTNPGGNPGTNPGGSPGTNPGGNPGTNPGGSPGTNPGGNPGTNPGGNPGTNPGGSPGTNPGGNPGTNPGGNPGTNPGENPNVGEIITDNRTPLSNIPNNSGNKTKTVPTPIASTEEVIEEDKVPLVGGGKGLSSSTGANGVKIANAPKTGKLANMILKQSLIYGTTILLMFVFLDEMTFRRRR